MSPFGDFENRKFFLLITKDNISEILPKLEVSESVKRNVTNAVREGKTVTIPERNIEQGEWMGTGYIVLDTETGSADI